jgi:hypothetical protein
MKGVGRMTRWQDATIVMKVYRRNKKMENDTVYGYRYSTVPYSKGFNGIRTVCEE